MASQGNSPNVSGPLASMFTGEALAAISAEEHVDKLAQQQIDIEQRATAAAAAAATAAAATAAEVEATASALLGSVGLPVQQVRASTFASAPPMASADTLPLFCLRRLPHRADEWRPL